jgi:SAM-dependent methyltransferase
MIPKCSKNNNQISESQELHPERWDTFYNQVSDIWLDMQGSPWNLGDSVAELLLSKRFIAESSSVLDVGSGPGTLSIPLAGKGCEVTALDQSEGMLKCLKTEAQHRNFSIRTYHGSWIEYPTKRKYDLTAAAFFPPACEPQGLLRMESWSKRYCSLVLHAGKDAFAIRNGLWREIMETPLPLRKNRIPRLMKHLLAAGRKPNLEQLSWKENLKIPLEKAIRFYSSYFAIFGRNDDVTKKAIRTFLESLTSNGKVEKAGCVSIAVICWKKPPVF